MTKRIAIHGLDGSSLDENLLRGALDGLIAHRYPDGIPDNSTWHSARAEILPEIYAAYAVAGYHNTLVTLITAYHAAATAARIAVVAAADAYGELTARTTTAWHAAHHRYIIAVTTAQESLTVKAQAADLLTQHHVDQFPGQVAHFYNQLVDEADRVSPPEIDDVAGQLVLFRTKHRQHLRTLSYTITGRYPLGFEPPDSILEPAGSTKVSAARAGTRLGKPILQGP